MGLADRLRRIATAKLGYLPVLAAALGAGALGGVLGTGRLTDAVTLIALVGAGGSLAAASATYLTVKEMREARRLQFQGHVAPQAIIGETELAVQLNAGQPVALRGESKVRVHNAGSGPALNLLIDWTSDRRINEAELAAINRVFSPLRVAQALAGFALDIRSERGVVRVPLSTGTLNVGWALGPQATYNVGVPGSILHEIAFRNLARLAQMIEGVRGIDLPRPQLILRFHHGSAYGGKVEDVFRFNVEPYGKPYRYQGQPVTEGEVRAGRWDEVLMKMRLRPTSPETEALPVVIIDPLP